MGKATGGNRLRVWIVRMVLGLVVATVGLLASAPWLIRLEPVQQVLRAQIQEQAAPASLVVGSVEPSWFGPTRIRGLVLRDPEGTTVGTAEHATWDRTLIQLISDRPRYGTLTIHQPDVTIVRAENGTIDLEQALRPILGLDSDEPSDPATQMQLVLERGRLSVQSPELAEPLTAEAFDFTLEVEPDDAPLRWTADLFGDVEGGVDDEPVHLSVVGQYGRLEDSDADLEEPTDLDLTIRAHRWPLVLDQSGLSLRTQLEGTLAIQQREGRWQTEGQAHLEDLEARGPMLAEDRLRIDRLGGSWELAQTEHGWDIRKLDLTCPLASLVVSGNDDANGTATRITGHIDLAALGRQIPHALHLRDGLSLEQGTAALDIQIEQQDQTQQIQAHVTLDSLTAAHDGQIIRMRSPADIEVQLVTGPKTLTIPKAAIQSEIVRVETQGDLDAGIQCKGTLELGAIHEQFQDLIDFGEVHLEGRVRFAGELRRMDSEADSFGARMAAEVQGLRVEGLTDTPIARPSGRLTGQVTGPLPSEGWPLAIAEAKFAWSSPSDGTIDAIQVAIRQSAPVDATGTAPKAYDLEAAVRTVWPPRDGAQPIAIQGRLDGRLDGSTVGFETLDMILSPPGQSPIRFAARGRFDSESGRLDLQPSVQLNEEGRASGSSAIPITLRPSDDGFQLDGLSGSGPLSALGGLSGDLDGIDRTLAILRDAEPMGLSGPIAARVETASDDQGQTRYRLGLASTGLMMASESEDGSPTTQNLGPAQLDGQFGWDAEAERLEVTDARLTTGLGQLRVTGTIDDLAGSRQAALNGMLQPNWPAWNQLLADRVEPGLRLEGGSRSFRIQGPLAGDSVEAILAGLDAEVGLDLNRAEAFGIRLGPTPLVLRCADGRMSLDPIATTLNDGQIELRPEIRRTEAGWALHLAEGTQIRDATIDNEVSRRVLSYIAPMLYEATQVQGQVSAEFSRVTVPMDGQAIANGVTARGQVTFQQVTYGASPFIQEIVAYTGRQIPPLLRLDRTLQVALEQGRVYQEGLTIGLGGRVPLSLSGSVGFDTSLKMRAEVPLSASLVGLPETHPLASTIAGTKVTLPISGTLSRPQFDTEAFRTALRGYSRTLVDQGIQLGRRELENQLDRAMRRILPGSPDADAPNSPASSDPASEITDRLLRRFLPQTRDPQQPSPPRQPQ